MEVFPLGERLNVGDERLALRPTSVRPGILHLFECTANKRYGALKPLLLSTFDPCVLLRHELNQVVYAKC